MRPIQVALVSAHPIWIEACRHMLESLPRKVEISPIVADEGLVDALTKTHLVRPGVVLLCLDLPFGGLNFARTLRSEGYRGKIMALCSRYSLPGSDELAASGVQSVVSSGESLEELALSLYSLVDGRAEPLSQQYLRATRGVMHQFQHPTLNAREREILQLVANDLTDRQIAERLEISVRTVNNLLRHIYAKLHVKGRAGAVAAAIMRSIICPPPG